MSKLAALALGPKGASGQHDGSILFVGILAGPRIRSVP
jgi:hypothetical protein